MKTYVLTDALIVLGIAVFSCLGVYLLRRYYERKAKKMTDMELVEAQNKEWAPGWFHKLKYEIYEKEFKSRPSDIPPSDID